MNPGLSRLKSYSELDALVGLDGVKAEVHSLLDKMHYYRLMQERGQTVLLEAQHLVFAGPPGTGKTTVARIFAKLLAEMGISRRALAEEVSRDTLVGEHVGSSTQLVKAAFERAQGGVLFIDEIHSLAADATGRGDYGHEVVNTLVKLMEDGRGDVIVIVAGYTGELARVFAVNPGLAERFSRTVNFPAYRPEELARIVDKLARDAGFTLSSEAGAAVRSYFLHGRGRRATGNGRTARKLFEATRDRMISRVMAEVHAGRTVPMAEILPVDVDPDFGRSVLSVGSRRADDGHLAQVLAELDALPGLRPVKQEVARLRARAGFAARRAALGLPGGADGRHLVFTGSPGTGKTTAARLYGEVLAAMGVLAQGQLVEVSRADLVGQWVGHTAQRTKEVFERARGGVLFIDEAYALVPAQSSPADFGAESVNTIIKLMEDFGEELVVVAAGHTDQMKAFLAANPGLADRFSRTVEFPDYTPGELVEIFQKMAADSGFEVDAEVLRLLGERFAAAGFAALPGNARFVEKTLSQMIDNLALRVAAAPDGDDVDVDVATLTAVDLPAADPGAKPWESGMKGGLGAGVKPWEPGKGDLGSGVKPW